MLIRNIVFVCVLVGVAYATYKPHVLVIGASERDQYMLSQPPRADRYTCSFIPPQAINDESQDCQHTADTIAQEYAGRIDGVLSTQDYIGNIVSTLVANKLHLPGPSICSVLSAQHKYYARQFQHACAPEATPTFTLLHPETIESDISEDQFPCFVKPAKAYFSFGANVMHSKQELQDRILDIMPADSFTDPLDALLTEYGYAHGANRLVAEDILHGHQVTLEGFRYHGETHILGITDAHMYPGTIAFKGFTYPSRLPHTAQEQMRAIARKLVSYMQLDNSFFNIEFMYDPHTRDVKIIEVNPRASPQFADLYERVDGINSYDIMLAIATNRPLPSYRPGSGPYAVAASFALRKFSDAYVTQSPSESNIAAIQKRFPDTYIKVHAETGEWLSDVLQDGNSYLYGLIHTGGKSHRHLLRKCNACNNMLRFSFSHEVDTWDL